MTNAEMMTLCDAMGVGVKSHSSTLIEAQADRLRRRAERDGLTRPEQPEELPETELLRLLGLPIDGRFWVTDEANGARDWMTPLIDNVDPEVTSMLARAERAVALLRPRLDCG